MSEEWTRTTLGEVVSLRRGISYKGEHTAAPNGVPFVNLKSVRPGGGYRPEGIKSYSGPVKDAQRLDRGALLVANTDLTRDRAILGCPVLLPESASSKTWTHSHHLTRLSLKSAATTYPFLALVLESDEARKYMVGRGRGTTVMGISSQDIAAMPLDLPPLSVQRRIVDLMEHLDTHIANLESERDRLVDVESALLESRFELTEVQSTQERITLGDLVSIRTGKLDVNQGSEDGKYPFFTCSRTVHRIDVSAFEGPSILVAGNGDLNVRFYDGEFNAYQRTYVLQPKKDVELPRLKFAYHFLRHYLDTLRENSSGSVIKYIRLGDLRDAQLPRVPLADVVTAVELFSANESLLTGLEDELSRILSVRHGLLNKLLSSETSLPESYDDLLGVAS